MTKWKYCVVNVTIFREGAGGPPRELLTVTLPGAHQASVTNAFGAMGLLNQLGSQGWELVDVEAGAFYLKQRAN